MNDYIVTLTNGDGEYDQVLVKGFSDGNKAANKAYEEYSRAGWHCARFRMIVKESKMFKKIFNVMCVVSTFGVFLSLLEENNFCWDLFISILFFSIWMCTSVIMLRLKEIIKGDKQ